MPHRQIADRIGFSKINSRGHVRQEDHRRSQPFQLHAKLFLSSSAAAFAPRPTTAVAESAVAERASARASAGFALNVPCLPAAAPIAAVHGRLQSLGHQLQPTRDALLQIARGRGEGGGGEGGERRLARRWVER